MVSTTLKLGISILNGGNCEVQQVCPLKTNHLDYVIDVKSITFCVTTVLSLFFQKMLEYLRDKKDVGFFLSVQSLMQTCWSVFNQLTLSLTKPLKHIHLKNVSIRSKFWLMFSTVSWIWMLLRGRTRQRVWAWFQRRAPVSLHVLFFSITFQCK